MSYVLLDNLCLSPAEQQDLRNHCVSAGQLVSGPLRTVTSRT